MLERPGSRWRTLIAVAFTVVFFDQWTKLLAVEHLTPGFLTAAAEPGGKPLAKLTADEREERLGSIGVFRSIAYFYGDGATQSPCATSGSRCQRVQVIGGFWTWRYAENPGAAWSMFAGTHEAFRRPFLVSVSSLAIVFIILFLRKLEPSQKMLALALSLICGGAIGNLIDRARLGYVIDFIEWYYGNVRWPTFNIADAAISTGVSLIALGMLLDLRAKKRAASQPAPPAEPQTSGPSGSGPLASSTP